MKSGRKRYIMGNRINITVDEFAKLLKAEGTTIITVSQRRLDKLKLNARKNEILNYILDEYNGFIRTEDIPNIARHFNATSQQIVGFCVSLRDDEKIEYKTKDYGYVLYNKLMKYIKVHGRQSVYALAEEFDVTPSSIISTVNLHGQITSCFSKTERLFIWRSKERDEYCRFKHMVCYAE
jgi:hypothetical protein